MSPRMANGPNMLCNGCGTINNRPHPFCDRCWGLYAGTLPGLTKADREYLAWLRARAETPPAPKHRGRCEYPNCGGECKECR